MKMSSLGSPKGKEEEQEHGPQDPTSLESAVHVTSLDYNDDDSNVSQEE